MLLLFVVSPFVSIHYTFRQGSSQSRLIVLTVSPDFEEPPRLLLAEPVPSRFTSQVSFPCLSQVLRDDRFSILKLKARAERFSFPGVRFISSYLPNVRFDEINDRDCLRAGCLQQRKSVTRSYGNDDTLDSPKEWIDKLWSRIRER